MQWFCLVFVFLIQQTTGEDFNTTSSNEFDDFELTTSFLLNVNDTTVDLVPKIELSPRVKRILSEIFRTYEPYCWRRSYGRGVGRPLHTCPDHSPEQDGLLCYPKCRDGYNGVGPVCWEKCDNLTSLGFACMNIRTSSRSCPWYDKCGVFQRSCTTCPQNYTNLGCLCGRFYFRNSYGRGIGTPLVCSGSYEQDGGLCYDRCDKKYNGVGPVCWQHCPSSQPFPCFAGCSVTQHDCQLAVVNMIQSVVGASVTLLNVVMGVPFVDLTTFDILANAAKGDWNSVAKHMSSLAKKLADKLLPELAKKFLNWSLDTIESATRNASVAITATAYKDRKSLMPLLKFFRLDSINSAYNHGKCDLQDDFENMLN